MEAVRPGHCCALIYTSGTTGRPKAVMITHDNFNFEVLAVMPLANGVGTKRTEERILSYLPTSHAAGMVRVIHHICLLEQGFSDHARVVLRSCSTS